MSGLRIGQLAQRAGVGVETIRFYERSGLVDVPARPPSGYRQYPEAAVSRIRFIRRTAELGFSLAEVRELLELRVDATASGGDVRRRAEAKMREIDAKIADLGKVREALAALIGRCDGEGPIGECPILEALDSGAEPWR